MSDYDSNRNPLVLCRENLETSLGRPEIVMGPWKGESQRRDPLILYVKPHRSWPTPRSMHVPDGLNTVKERLEK